MVTATSLIAIFVGVIVLLGVIVLMTKFLVHETPDTQPVIDQQKKGVEKSVTPIATPIAAPIAAPILDLEIDEELIAVITAAIAASLKTSIHNIVVSNIVRVPDETPPWAINGRLDQMKARF